MTCNHCGFKLHENAKFCPQCGAPAGSSFPSAEGAPASPPASFSKSTKKQKNRAAALWAITAAALAIILLLQNLGLVGLVTDSAAKISGKRGPGLAQVEGTGYDSAEEAVKAYIEALRQGDVQAMLSTFAVETYVDSYDTKAGLGLTGAWLPVSSFDGAYEIVGSDYERQLRYLGRQAFLSQRLYSQLLTYTAFLGGGSEAIGSSVPIPFEKEHDIDVFLDAYRKNAFGKALAEMELQEFVDPADLSEAYGSEAMQKHMEERRKIYGCDRYESIAARVSLNGEDWLLTMDCAEYRGRWYNLNPSGNLATMLGIGVEQWGLVPWSALR